MATEPSGALPEHHPLYAPGLKWRERKSGRVAMWLPRPEDVKIGYRPKSLVLNRDLSPADIAATCRRQWKDLLEWRKGTKNAAPVRHTVGWLIDRYLFDEHSPFQKLKPDTQQSYQWECKRIKETIGERLLGAKVEGGTVIPRIVGEDIRRWYYEWGHPPPRQVKQPDGSVKLVEQKPTPSRARHCLAMLRTLASYNVELGTFGAAELRERLRAMRFDGPHARTRAPTYDQVDAIVSKAIEMGFRSIAIATLAQFELIERRTHIIGQWHADVWGYGWVWDGHVVVGGERQWVGVTSDWRIRYYQTKKGANLREFDLKVVQRLLGLLQETPQEKRQGAIIICETTGLPWEKRRYQEKFREIARAAGVPDEIYSMDMRSGGATEADDIPGVTDRMFDDGGGWADPQMKNRYRRQKQRNAQKVVELRQEARKK